MTEIKVCQGFLYFQTIDYTGELIPFAIESNFKLFVSFQMNFNSSRPKLQKMKKI